MRSSAIGQATGKNARVTTAPLSSSLVTSLPFQPSSGLALHQHTTACLSITTGRQVTPRVALRSFARPTTIIDVGDDARSRLRYGGRG